MNRPVFALLAAAALAGCSLAPPHTRPPFAAGTAYPPEYQPEAGTRRATDIGWQDFFTDPRLQALIQMADMASRSSPPVSRNRGIQTSPAFEALYRVDSAGGIRLGQRLLITRPLRTEGVWDTSLPSQRFPNDFAIRSGEPMRGDVRKVAGPIM